MTLKEFEEKLKPSYDNSKLGSIMGVSGKRIQNVRALGGIEALYNMAIKKGVDLDNVDFETLRKVKIERKRKSRTSTGEPEKEPEFKKGDMVEIGNNMRGIIDTIERIGKSYVYVVLNELGRYQPFVESKLKKLQKGDDYD